MFQSRGLWKSDGATEKGEDAWVGPVGVEWSVDEILRAREPRKRQVTE